jgi:hypothetical protein
MDECFFQSIQDGMWDANEQSRGLMTMLEVEMFSAQIRSSAALSVLVHVPNFVPFDSD